MPWVENVELKKLHILFTSILVFEITLRNITNINYGYIKQNIFRSHGITILNHQQKLSSDRELNDPN